MIRREQNTNCIQSTNSVSFNGAITFDKPNASALIADKAAARRRNVGLSALVALAITALIGCAHQDPGGSESDSPAPKPAACSCEEEAVVDPTLLAFLSLARAAHHDADLSVEAGDRAAAVAALTRVVKAPWPGKKPPEVIEVSADTLARIADLESEDDKFDDASRHVEEGIALATEPTHFRGRLFEVRGLVEERRSKALAAKGDTTGAENARKEALKAYGQALDIQEDVIARALKAKEKDTPPGGSAQPTGTSKPFK
ncbi:MAG: hypothetical protein IPK82_01355 [Polyangiaceae bacterium]|nr:hypothetical protein [Polyangiaceae bacterium]